MVSQELYRVLKPGSKVAVLDFNNTEDPLVDQFQAFSLENIVVPAARIYGLAEEYEYLRPSIKRFATGDPTYILQSCNHKPYHGATKQLVCACIFREAARGAGKDGWVC